jgi:trimeric autotransporter adhesin
MSFSTAMEKAIRGRWNRPMARSMATFPGEVLRQRRTAMNRIPSILSLMVLSCLVLGLGNTQAAAPMGNGFTYQGRLSEGGAPATGRFDLLLELFGEPGGGTPLAPPVSTNNLAVSNGLFTVTLDFGPGVFVGQARWLQISVRTNGGTGYITLSARQALTPAPQALYAETCGSASNLLGTVPDAKLSTNIARLSADQTYTGTLTLDPVTGRPPIVIPNPTNIFTITNFGADLLDGLHAKDFWQLKGNAATTPGSDFVGTLDNKSLWLMVNSNRALLLEPNATCPAVIGGFQGNNSGGAAGATIGGGGQSGKPNVVTANFGTVGGGDSNVVNALSSTISGGHANQVQVNASYATIGGGSDHVVQANAEHATISGGGANIIRPGATYSTIGGGGGNTIDTNTVSSVISGGALNLIGTNANCATIGGGTENSIGSEAHVSTIGGGTKNHLQDNARYSTIAGGNDNSIGPWGLKSAIGGGAGNIIETNFGSTISGGVQNTIQSSATYSAIGGGGKNVIQTNTIYSAIGGGGGNTIAANGSYSAIGGGAANLIQPSINYATIPGGVSNQVGADFGFAAGRRAQALAQGSFVWADSADADFASTNANEFAVRARGGVRFDTGGAGVTVDGQKLGSGGTVGLGTNSVATSNLMDGAVTSAKIASGTIQASNVNAGSFANTFWKVDGNAGTTNGNFLGTTDFQALEVRVNNNRALLLEPNGTSPNVVGGYLGNSAGGAVAGAAIGGGGQLNKVNSVSANFGTIGGGEANGVMSTYSTIGGGAANSVANNSGYSFVGGGNQNMVQAGSAYSAIGGGQQNIISSGAGYSVIAGGDSHGVALNADHATIGGGIGNQIRDSVRYSTIAGGHLNTIGPGSLASSVIGGGGGNAIEKVSYATIAGGDFNTIQTNADCAAILGGNENRIGTNATYAAIGGGRGNFIAPSTSYADIPGGCSNVVAGPYGFAAGRRAKALAQGNFVWADSTDADFASTNANEFAVRATGGVRLDTGGQGLTLNGNVVAGGFGGSGAGLTNVTASGLASGTYSGLLQFDNPANSYIGGFLGNAGGLTNISATSLVGTLPSPALAGTYTAPVSIVNPGNNFGGNFSGNGSGLTNVQPAPSTNYWNITGNSGTGPANFLGTTDNQALEVRVNSARAWRVEPNPTSPNLIGGVAANAAVGALGAAIGGGGNSAEPNQVAANYGSIGGGRSNTVAGADSTIGGGSHNVILAATNATIGGGDGNIIHVGSHESTIGGGTQNTIQPNVNDATIGGGDNNTIEMFCHESTIGGGNLNQMKANSAESVIGGGIQNAIYSSLKATIGGGFNNLILSNSHGATLAGGESQAIGPGANDAAIGGGIYNVVGTNANYGTIPGGYSNEVRAAYGLAAGNRAQALHQGAFVWADSQPSSFASTLPDQVSFRCGGGVRFTSGSGAANQTASWTPGSGGWTFPSDRNLKENFNHVDTGAVLERISRLPITEWNYKGYEQRHIGPMAQDFHALFPLNESDTTLNEADLHGVALAAIQGLNDKLKEKDAEIQKLKEKAAQVDALEKRLAALEQLIQSQKAK